MDMKNIFKTVINRKMGGNKKNSMLTFPKHKKGRYDNRRLHKENKGQGKKLI